MKITKEHVGKIFSVKDVPQSEPCLNCTPCLRLRIMEMGIIPGEKIELEKARTNLTETEQKLMLQLESAKTEYNYSLEELETSKQNLALAERIENKQQIKFFEGISTSFELTEAQRQLYSMQQNYLQAMFSIIANKATLDNALNTPINN